MFREIFSIGIYFAALTAILVAAISISLVTFIYTMYVSIKELWGFFYVWYNENN